MPLKALVDAQLDDLRRFLDQPGRPLRVLRHLPDTRPVLLKLLAGVQDEDDFPHAIVMVDLPFMEEESFCAAVLAELIDGNESHRESLAAEEVVLPSPPAHDAPVGPVEREFGRRVREPSVEVLSRYVSEVAEVCGKVGAAYVLLIDPKSVHDEDPDGFPDTMVLLADSITSERGKVIVLDSLDSPRLDGIDRRTERADVQTFEIGPDEIERQVKTDLDSGGLEVPDLCKYLMMAGAFAASRGDHAAAIGFNSRALEVGEQIDEPAGQAQSLYNIGTSQMESGDLETAVGSLGRAAEICIDEELDPLLAMVMINLGVTLHRDSQVDEALDAFDVARNTFRALDNRPGEAYALDNRAAVLAVEERNEEAEASWLEELELLDSITNEAMPELRSSSREDVVAKLTRFYEETGQREKIPALQTGEEAG